MTTFGLGVRKLREANAHSLQELAVRARIPWHTLRQIESDAHFPRLSELDRLLSALNARFIDVCLAAQPTTVCPRS